MKRFWLPLILILAFLLRFVNLTSYPVGFNADEASFGYDAYSILKTGRDQWGNFFPLTLKSFGDYKAPLYSYLAIPFVAIFGLSEFMVRLPNVLMGLMSVYIVYLLTREIRVRLKIKLELEVFVSLLLAISPWSIMLSRGAFEANLVVLFVPLGIYLFLKEKLNLSAMIFGLSLFTYHSAKILSPLIFISLFVIFKKKKFLPVLIYLLFFGSMLWTLITGAGARISERSITVGALEEGARTKIALIQSGTNPVIAKLFHNKYQVTVERFVNNYLQYFSPRFLLSQGAGEFYYGMMHGVGVIYLFEGILFFGVFKLISNVKYKKTILLLCLWLLIAPVPAALSTGVGFSGHRASGMMPVIQILMGFGFLGWFQIFKNFTKNQKNIATVILFILVIINLHKFLNIYFKNIPQESYRQMLFGNVEFSKWIFENSKSKNVIISRSLSEPQIFLAFSQKIEPSYYQSEAKKWNVKTWVDQIPEYSLGKYKIKSIDWKLDATRNILLVARPEEFPKGILPDKAFDLPDGTPIIYVKSY